MNKIEWALSTILTYALILTAIKVITPVLFNYITEPQIAVISGLTIALIEVLKQKTKQKSLY
jgi:hypothetical protein